MSVLVYRQLCLPEDIRQEGALPYEDGVGGLLADQILRVFDERSLGVLHTQILIDASSHGCREHLYATADAQQGQLSVQGTPYEAELGPVALGIDAMQLRYRLLAHQQRVHIRPAAQHHGIQSVQQGLQGLIVQIGRYHHGAATGQQYAAVVAGCQLAPFLAIVGGYAYEGYHHGMCYWGKGGLVGRVGLV